MRYFGLAACLSMSFWALPALGADSAFALDQDENACLQTAASFSAFGACIKEASLKSVDRRKPKYEQKEFFSVIDTLSGDTDAGRLDIQAAMNNYVQARAHFQQVEQRRWLEEEEQNEQARARALIAAEDADAATRRLFDEAPSSTLPASGTYMMQRGPRGNATFNQPGQAPSTIQRFGNTTIINTPGQAPAVVQRNGNGAVVTSPGHAPTTIHSTGPGSAIINEPGQAPTVVNQTGNVTTFTQGGTQKTCIKTGTMITCN